MAERKTGEPLFKRHPLPWPLLLILLILVVMITVLSFVYFQKQKKIILQEATSQLQAIADLKAREIGDWLGERLADARVIQQNRDRLAILSAYLRDRSSATRRESIRSWMIVFQENYHYENVLLLDGRGEVVLAASPHHLMVGAEGLKAIETARRRRDVVLADLHSNPQMPHIHMGMVAPILAGNEAMGFILLRIDPERYLFPMIQAWPTLSPSAETLLVRRDGDDVLFLNELRHRQGSALKLRFPINAGDLPAAQALRGKTGAFSGRDYRGIAVSSVIRQVPNSPWFIVAKVDRVEIEHPVQRQALAVFLVALSLLLAAAAPILIVWQRQAVRFRLRQFEAENQKLALERHYDYLTRYANDIILLADDRLRIIEANERAILVYGYDRQSLLSMNQRDLRLPGERDKLVEHFRGVTSMSGMIFETRHLRKDGSDFPVEVSARLIEVEGRKYFQSIIRDISERKRAEEALRESEVKFRQVFEVANVGKSITLPTGEIHVNQAFCDMLGYEKDELNKKTWQEITPADEVDSIQKILEPLMNGQKDGVRFNKRYIHKNGSHVWTDVSVAIQRDPAGKPLHFITTIVDISERKQAETALKASEKKFRTVLDATPFPIAIVDLQDDRIFYWSRSATALFGHTAPTASEWYEIAYPDPDYRRDVVERWKPFLEKARASGLPVNTGEYRVTCRDGSERICELYATFLVDSLIVTFNDISKRKQAETDLQMAYKRLRTFIDANIIGIIIASPGGRIIEANDYYLKLIGASRDDFDRGLIDWRAITPPEWLATDERALRELKETGKCLPYEKEYARPDGKRVPVYIVDAMLPGPEEQIAAFILDLSEHKRAEDEIRALSARNQALLEAVPDIIMEVDNNKVYKWANHAGLQFFGDEVIGREASDYFLGEQEVYQVVKPLFNGYEDTIYLESWQRRRDGEKRLLAWWCRVLKDEAGKVSGALSSARDITETKLAETEIRRLNEELEQRVLQRTAQLQASNRELEAFSYSVSHDLRAPLRAISGFTQILLDEYAPKLDKEARRLLDVITGNTGKMGQLIDDLLAFSRLSRQRMASASVNLAVIAKVVFAELKNQEKNRIIEFKVTDPPVARGDHSMLQQVLQNLLANAVKFTRHRKPARIEFGGRVENSENVYFVRDNGVGFDMKYADKLFGVFQRLHSTDEFEGTGVGLAIVQRIVQRHGGRAWAESGKKGGATFYFTLPSSEGTGDRGQGTGKKEKALEEKKEE